MPISALPTTPSSASPTTFAADMDAFLPALGTFRTEANAMAAAMTAVAAGGAVSLQYTFSTTITDADPGAGILRLSSATQNTSTVIRADLAGSDGSDLTAILALLDDSTSTNKGYITLRHATTATKWLVFSVASLASPAGYRNVTVACVASSAASPFANGDALLFDFTPNGDVGTTGATGAGITAQTVGWTGTAGTTPKTLTVDDDLTTAQAARRNAVNTFAGAQIGTVTALTSSAAAMAINLATNNNFSHTTSENTTLSAPSNPVAGQSGVIVITQGATARTLAYNTFYKFAGGTVPTLTATASAVDTFAYYVESATRATCQLIKGVA